MERAALYAAKGDAAAAGLDSKRACGLKPRSLDCYLGRGLIEFMEKKYGEAVADLTEAIKLNPDSARAYTLRQRTYESARQWDNAIRDSDQLGKMLPENIGALNGRCWTRAEADRDLDRALDYCDEALKLQPKAAPIIDSRAFVRFRMGQFDKAIADEDEAIRLAPTAAAYFYVRGLAKRRLGDTAAGDADIAAAKAISPKIADSYADIGVAP